MTKLLLRKTCARSGFSLVEVTLCLAVVCVVGMTVIGLIPEGLINLRSAMNNTAESQIVEGITNNIVLTSYKNLPNLYPPVAFYYDVQGIPLTASGSGAPVGTVYTATIVNPNNHPNDPAVPGDLSNNFNGGSGSASTFSGFSGSTGLSSGISTVVTIKVAKANQPLSPDYFPIIIANNQGLALQNPSTGP